MEKCTCSNCSKPTCLFKGENRPPVYKECWWSYEKLISFRNNKNDSKEECTCDLLCCNVLFYCKLIIERLLYLIQ